MYAFRRATLEAFSALSPSPQELAERLEQMRVLHAGMRIAVADAPFETVAVDEPGDLDAVRREVLLHLDKPLAVR